MTTDIFSNKYVIAFVALFTIPISGLGIDIYVPSLPAVSQFFHVDPSLVQLSITVYMLGLGLPQLIVGGVSDTYGRRNPALIALFVFIVTTLLIPLAFN